MFNFLVAMELAVKRHYRMGQYKTASQPEVEKRVKDDDEVLFWGDTLSGILSIDQAVLELLVSLYVYTILRLYVYILLDGTVYTSNDPGRLFKRLAAYTSCSNTIKHFLHTYCIFTSWPRATKLSMCKSFWVGLGWLIDKFILICLLINSILKPSCSLNEGKLQFHYVVCAI